MVIEVVKLMLLDVVVYYDETSEVEKEKQGEEVVFLVDGNC